jgi:ATPase subunit of ABC transporter with duplicated ATPase domains
VLSLERVSFAYPGAAPLFQEASAEVRCGDRVAVTGPNGRARRRCSA